MHEHEWHPVIWRIRVDSFDAVERHTEYQRGCVCLTCPSHVWLDEHYEEAWRKNRTYELPMDQWRWWLDRIAGRPMTPWPIPDGRGPGPFGPDLLPDQLDWPTS